MKKNNNANNKNIKVTKQDIEKWSKKLTVKSKKILKICLISGISLIAIGGSVGGYFIYRNIKLEEAARNKCTVTFNTNGGSHINNAQITRGQKLEKPDDPKLEGFILYNWYFDSEFKNEVKFPFIVNNDMTLYAKWTTAFYDVKYYVEPGEEWDSKTVAYKKSVNRPPEKVPTKQGYKFAGWYTIDEVRNNETKYKRFYYDEEITEDTYVYAKWVDENEKNIVTFDYGTDPAHTEKYNVYEYDVDKDTAIAEPEKPQYQGYKFTDWRTNLADPNSKWNFSSQVVSDMNLYAKWNIEGHYSLTYSYGDGKSFKTVPVEKNTQLTKLEKPTYDGYVFQKWYLDEALTNPVTLPLTMDEDKVLYADWAEEAWYVTEEEYKDSFRHLVDIEGTEHIKQQYLADGYCRKSTKQGSEEAVIDFNVSYLYVNDEYEKCGVNGADDKPYLYTKKQDNFYIYARADNNNRGTYEGIKEVNIRSQLAEVFAPIYDSYNDLKIDKEIQAFTYEFKDSEYEIESTIKFYNRVIKSIDCNYEHTINNVTTAYEIHFNYNYYEPSIPFPSNIDFLNELDNHIHQFDNRSELVTPIPIKTGATPGEHIVKTQTNKTPGDLQNFKCYQADGSNLVPIDFITEDVTIYRNDKLLTSEEYEFKTVDSVKVLSLKTPTVVEPKPETISVLLKVNTQFNKEIYIKFVK